MHLFPLHARSPSWLTVQGASRLGTGDIGPRGHLVRTRMRQSLSTTRLSAMSSTGSRPGTNTCHGLILRDLKTSKTCCACRRSSSRTAWTHRRTVICSSTSVLRRAREIWLLLQTRSMGPAPPSTSGRDTTGVSWLVTSCRVSVVSA